MKKGIIGGGLLFIMAILVFFPFGWLADISSRARSVVWGMFGSERMHWIGHFGIFFLLGLTLLYVFPRLRQSPIWYGLIILISGIGQEFFQLLYKQRDIAFDDFKDLAIDLVGAFVAFGLVWLWQKLRKPKILQSNL
jgi:hypothetical protein